MDERRAITPSILLSLLLYNVDRIETLFLWRNDRLGYCGYIIAIHLDLEFKSFVTSGPIFFLSSTVGSKLVLNSIGGPTFMNGAETPMKKSHLIPLHHDKQPLVKSCLNICYPI